MTAQLDETLNQIKVEMRYSQLTLSTPSTRQTIISNPSGSQCIRRIIFCLALLFATFAVQAQTEIASLSELTETGDFVITDDISASGYSSLATFSGTLTGRAREDGTLPAITGLSVPLFTTATDATISGIMFSDVSVSGSGNVGTVAANANGSTRIFNCGILGGTVGGTAYTGGLVGLLDGEARVINCFSYANITGGSDVGGIVGYNNVATNKNNLKTMVMNCMFYGDITGGTTKAPIYGGKMISNKDDNGVGNFNYFLAEASYVQNAQIDVYNCALMAETRYLQRFEFFRHLLNGHRELAAWWATGSVDNKDQMLKWVLEPLQIGSATPYPILKTPGYYPSVVNIDAENATVTSERNKGGKLGTLSVTIQMGDGKVYQHPSGAAITKSSLTLNITDKDPEHFNFNYYKVQLPYYNDVGTGNYTENRVVTGWKIVSITGGTTGNFTDDGDDATADGEGNITSAPYNFADRKCTAKDLFSSSGRVFNQGAYFDVPEGVTAITIQPYWAKAAYCADDYRDVIYNTNMNTKKYVNTVGGGQWFSNGKDMVINGSSQKVYSVVTNARDALGDMSSHTVYDNAVVLVGNVHQNGISSDKASKPYTIMSIDLDHDNEPDYSYILRFDGRSQTHPVRVDFINIPGLGMAQKSTGAKGSYNLGIMQPIGMFESTNTSLFRVTQFEYDRNERGKAPYIVQGGVIEQWVSGQNNGAANKTTYYHVGGNVWFKEFHRGTHQDNTYTSKHPPVSVTGGDYDEFYLTGLYRGDINNYDDNAECYINGGRFGIVAGAAQEGIGNATTHANGNIVWQVQNADISEFYGGGINAAHPVEGNITNVITGGYIKQFCGGPKFGDMREGKTVITRADGCEFDTYYGAGYGGNSYSRRAPSNRNQVINTDWNNWVATEYTQSYDATYKGVSTQINYQFLPYSNNQSNVARLFVEYVSFSLATTRNVTSHLTQCTINNNFYGGGNLGKVNGPVTSTLTDCTVKGNVFGAGYSATLPTVEVMNLGGFQTEPRYDENAGVFLPGVFPDTQTYTWQYREETVNSTARAIDTGNHILYTNEDLTTLGTVTGTTTLNICGTTTVAGSVYGGGEESDATDEVLVNMKGGTISKDIYGGGALANTGNTTVSLSGGNVMRDVYGGGLGDRESLGAGHADVEALVGNSLVELNKNTATDNCVVFGSIYGCNNISGTPKGTTQVHIYKTAGSGDAKARTAADKLASPTAADHTYELLAVYGGGNQAAYVPTDENGHTDVIIDGAGLSSIKYVYGGGNVAAVPATQVTMNGSYEIGDVFGGGNQAGVSNTTLVNVNGGRITDGVYGGCNSSGDVTGDITVNMLGGTPGVAGCPLTNGIFGGGYGQATTTSGNVDVNINGASLVVHGDVYGGSALGQVNSDTDDYTHVTLTAGTLHGDAYGGGLGNTEHAALVKGNVKVTQNGVDFVKATTTDDKGNEVVTAGRIFGCNNLNGTPLGTVLVLVKKTGSTNPTKGAYQMQAVYGGGNLAAYSPTDPEATGQYAENEHDATKRPLQVVIDGCETASIEYVYGGGNAAPTPSTDVVILGDFEIDLLFGGGNGRDRFTRNGTDWEANPGADVGIKAGTSYGTGDANTIIYGGTIHEAYGASNQKGSIRGSINLNVQEDGVCPLNIDKMVGAGRNADIDGDVILVMGCMPDTKTALVFGGADNANVNGNVELTITSGTFGQVFGGNNLGGIIKGHLKVNIEETGCRPIKIDELYLGGNEAAYSVFGYYDSGETDTFDRPIYLPRVSADDANAAIANPAADANHSFPYAQPVLNVISCTSIGKVFGGGLGTGAAMYANPTVNINMIPGKYANLLPDDENNPNRLGAVENVYGGGNEAAVHGNTTVNVGTTIGQEITLASTGATANVLGAYITGTVYGAGKGIASDPDAAIVTGNTQVNLGGGHVLRSIYGGGELGSVGTFTEKWDASQFDSDKKAWHFKDEPKACKEGTGLAEVIITGGQVGLNGQLMPDPTKPTADDDFGYVFCASKGIADSLTYEKANLLAVVGKTHLEVSGGLIIASVYGGSENGEVLTDTHVEIKGGQIGTGHYKEGEEDRWDGIYEDDAWTAAIDKVKAGTFTDADAAGFHLCDAWPFGPEGDRHVYDYFADTEGYDAKGGASPGSDGHSYFGHVFGGGSGYYPFAAGMWRRTAGRVCGNTKVDITGGHILTNVYGGNEITDVLGTSRVEMTGGTIGVPRTMADIQGRPVNCNLFGAGMGDPRVLFNGWSNVASTEVIVKGEAVVFGSVFGGGEDGHVWGNASTTIEGNAVVGTFGSSGVDGNVFGSGRGFSGIALTAGVVCGNVEVNINGNAKVYGSVFGGGRMAAVGTFLAAEDDENYGAMQAGDTHGNVIVNITGGTIGNQSKMTDHDYSTGDVFGGSKGVLIDEWAKSQKLGLVKNTTVNISQADAASPTIIYGNVYGGGEIASVGYYKYATAEEAASYNATHTLEEMSVGDVYALLDENAGTATINITGGTIGQNSTTDTHGLVFGGCLGKSGKDYSGYSFVNKSFVTLDGGTVYGSVFGGGENGHVFNDTDVEIKGGTVGIPLDKEHIADAALVDNLIYRGNVYGGGRGIDMTPSGDYSITAGKVAGNTKVNVTGGNIYRNVYGGGSLASVGDPNETADTDGNYKTGLATVNITGGQIGTDGAASANDYTSTSTTPIREHRRENGFVFGSGRGMAAGSVGNKTLVDMAYVKNTLVTIAGEANVTGSVFGGGENGHVRKDTKVYVKENCFIGTELNDAEHEIDDNGRGRLLYRGNAYGGGRGIDHMTDDPSKYSYTAGRVDGNTYIEVSGGKIYHDVFGGGSLASVGTATVNDVTGEVTYEGETGNSVVRIKGGIIGYSSDADKQGFNCGFVYGGCRGLAVAPDDDAVKMAYVHHASVFIEPGADIKGSVFGGGANGHVKGNTDVEISGGSIGTALQDDEVGFDDYGVAVKPVFRGNVYAGGRGVDLYQQEGTDRYSLTAGAVYGNATLKMTGGHVWHNIYGSGAMASVGTVKAKPEGTHVHDEIVDAGGNIVNPDGSDVNYLTGVFTEGTGNVWVTITGGTVGDTTPGHEGRANGRVYGAGRGVSANRSDYVASMEYVSNTYVTIGTSGQTGWTAGTDAPYIYGAVFGGGENGHVKNDTHVDIHSGIIGWPLDEGESQQHKTAADGSSKNPFFGHVFGGGRGVDPLYHSATATRSSTAGRVYGHTNVTMTGGVVRRAIYGGGLLASVGIYRLDADLHILDEIEDEVNAGKATITISGGLIGNVNPDGTAVTGTAVLAPGDNNGHVFGSSCGMVADNYTVGGVAIDRQYQQMGYSHSTEVNVLGGHLFGSVFGSGENGHVWSDARINISGGEIGSEESTLIYSGNVYGSGRGVDHPNGTISETAGKVRGNTTVNITGGIIWRDVYGGGSLASVGEEGEEGDDSYISVTSDPLTTNPYPYATGLTRVYIHGTSATPEVHGSVYGSGRGVASTLTAYRQAAYVKNTLVTIGKARVYQNVFGGGNAGHVRRNTVVDILDGAKVDGNVYGGGAGSIKSPTAGLVNHDVAVNILGGLIAGDVYGGGAIANSNTHDRRNDPSLYADGTTAKAHASTDGNPSENSTCTTDVNLTGGIILGNAYGGGQGVIPGAGATAAEIANAAALVRGNVKVTLNGTAFRITTTKDDQGNNIAATGRVFGCNNLNGTPQGTVLVHVLRTRGVTESGGTYTVNDTKPEKGTDTYEVQAVYGGGNLAAYEPWEETADGQYTHNGHVATQRPLQVVVDGCDEASIEYVYGGGNAAATPSTDVLMVGCYEVGYLFGGGNGKDRIYKSETWSANPGADVGYADGTVSYGTGEAIVEALGGTIGSIFGGSNTLGNVRHSSVAYLDEGGDCSLDIEEVYGGGNEAPMAGNSQVKLGCITRLKALYGGAKAAPVGGDIVLTITSGHYDRVFGGNNISGEISGSITVNVEETGCHPITIGELYGCGNQAAYTTHEGKADPVINVKSFTSIGRIFGGGLGEGAVVKGNPTVNINEVTGLRSTYSPWAYPGTTITYKDGTSVTLPTHESGKIGAIGTVFGGGNAAKVEGNTSVNIGTLENVVFVTPETDSEADRTKAVEGVNILGNVFGGGNEAEVSGKSNVVIGRK